MIAPRNDGQTFAQAGNVSGNALCGNSICDESAMDGGSASAPLCGASLLSAPLQTIRDRAEGVSKPVANVGPSVLLHGVDTAYFSLFVSWGDLAAQVIETIRVAKGESKTETGTGHCVLEGLEAVVQPTGTRKADGPYFEYRLSIGGFELEIRDPDRQNDQIPDIVVKAGAIKCMECGNSIAAVWDAVEDVIQHLGATVELALPSRVDRFFDLALDFGTMFEAFEANDLVCRGRRKDAFGMIERKVTRHMMGCHPEGFSVGGDLMLRCYDKRREVLKSADKALLLEARWQHAGPVSRVEFQLRRDALKSRGIVTVLDLIEQWERMSAYLVKCWASFREGAGQDRRNLKRKPVHAFWRVLRDHTSIQRFEPIETVKREHVRRRRDQWTAQIQGCIVSMAAEEGIQGAEGYLAFVESIPDLLLGDGVLRGVEQPVERLKEREHYRRSKSGSGGLEAIRIRRATEVLAACEERMAVMDIVAGERRAWTSRIWTGSRWVEVCDVPESARVRRYGQRCPVPEEAGAF